jgi:hypothetical protein
MTQRPSGIPGFSRGLFVLLLVALAASSSRAEPTRSTGPFADLDAINIAVEIGGPLDLQGSTAPELLTGEVGRFNRFRSTLERSVGEKLESCGILWDEGAVDEVSITVFGRREILPQSPPQGPPHYLYMVQVEVLNTTLASRGAKPETVALRPVLGLADEAGLERALIDTAVAILAGELRNCDGP